MAEHTGVGAGGRTDLAHLHEALTAAYSEVLADSRNQAEGLDRAVCGPHLKHLAEIAAAAAADGVPAAEWRADVLTRIGPSARGPLDSAEACMRQVGLWPWHP